MDKYIEISAMLWLRGESEMDSFERYRKEMEIRGRIGNLRSEIIRLRNLISNYNTCRQEIVVAMDNWKTKRIAYQNILLEAVKVDSYFEGVCAEKVKEELLPTIILMDNANGKMAGIRTYIPNQIQLLEGRIQELGAQIAALEAELAAL